jgi:predicted chitinase
MYLSSLPLILLLATIVAAVPGAEPIPNPETPCTELAKTMCSDQDTQLICNGKKWVALDCTARCTDSTCDAVADKEAEKKVGDEIQAARDASKPKEDDDWARLVRREEEEEEEEDDGGGKPLVTQAQFTAAVKSAGYPCPGPAKYKAFVKVAAKEGNIKCKRELAMFLTQVLWESDGLRAKVEYKCRTNGCPKEYRHKLDKPGKKYFGRGYIQLTWAYNYKACSRDLYKDDRLLKHPGSVGRDEVLSWATAAWFWKKNVHKVTNSGRFGLTTKAINGALECGKGPNVKKARIRFQKYRKVFKAFGLSGKPLEGGCYN